MWDLFGITDRETAVKSIDVYGLGNGIVDVLLEVTEDEFSALEFERGTMRLLEPSDQQALLEQFSEKKKSLVSGGSVANSIVTLRQLGGSPAFSCALGDDSYGLHYKGEFEGLEIAFPSRLEVGKPTGTCVILITPDAERTMRTSLGVSADFSEGDVDEETIRQSQWIFIEGYLFSNPDKGHAAIEKAIALAKKHETKVAVTFSEAWVVESFGDALRKATASADLVFANEGEAKAFGESEKVEDGFFALGEQVKNVVVTLGEKGAMVKTPFFEGLVPAFPVIPTDLTGAGDAMAGSFLYGLTQGVEVERAARASCYIASKVIQKVGARLPGSGTQLWQEGIYDERIPAVSQ